MIIHPFTGFLLFNLDLMRFQRSPIKAVVAAITKLDSPNDRNTITLATPMRFLVFRIQALDVNRQKYFNGLLPIYYLLRLRSPRCATRIEIV